MSALHPRPPAGWAPRSGCTGGCLPAAGTGPRWRVVRRLTALVVVVVAAVVGGLLLPARARRARLAACCRAALAAAGVRAGDVVVAIPEGTTWCGTAAGPFGRAAFRAADDAGAPVRPVAIRLLDDVGTRAAGAVFVGEQTLADSVGRVLRAPGLVREVTVLAAVVPGPASTRRELARAAGEAVAAVTGVAHPVRRSDAPPAPAVTREASVAA